MKKMIDLIFRRLAKSVVYMFFMYLVLMIALQLFTWSYSWSSYLFDKWF